MSKSILLAFLFFVVPLQFIESAEFFTRYGETVRLEPCKMRDLPQCEAIFIESFAKTYESFTPEMLGVSDKVQFLKIAFEDVYEDCEQNLQKLVVAKIKDEIVGFAGFKETEKKGEIYITQLAVKPIHWQKGIGTQLIFSSFAYFDRIESLVVIPRKINEIAQQFYESLGFHTSAYMHPGYSAEKYVGYEWKNSNLSRTNEVGVVSNVHSSRSFY